MDREIVKARINALIQENYLRNAKYRESLAYYTETPYSMLTHSDEMVAGYDYERGQENYPRINIIKSVVDSIVSMVSTAHCRPFVNSVNGSYKTIQVCKELQIFFDYLFDEKQVARRAVEALRDACVFDTGYLYYDYTNTEIEVIKPYDVYYSRNEKHPKDVYFITDYKRGVRSGVYINLEKSEIWKVEDDRLENVGKPYKYTEFPLVEMQYMPPVEGRESMSVSDILRGIQSELDTLLIRIAESSKLTPANLIFINQALGGVTPESIDNEVGKIYTYRSNADAQPFNVVTPSFISDQYMNAVQTFIELAYNTCGVSQLYSQGKKPAGINSGIALATLNDINSDRFQVILDDYIRLYTTLARKIAYFGTSDSDILPKSRYHLSIKWQDVKTEYDKLRIQFSAADSLSKDPSTRLDQLQKLAETGIIPMSQIASLLELPDINRGFSVANNAYNAALTVIDKCIYEDKYEIPSYIPYILLKEQTINTIMNLTASQGGGDSNQKDIEKLEKLYEKIVEKENEMTGIGENDISAGGANGSVSGYNLGQGGAEKATPYETDIVNGGELTNGN